VAEPASEIVDDDLPPVVAEMRRLIGTAATLALVRAYGGASLYMPERFDAEHLIVPIVGHEAAQILMRQFARERIYIPKCDGALNIRRNIQISRRYEAGTPVRHLAHEHGLSERQIWNILKRVETLREYPQQPLFED